VFVVPEKVGYMTNEKRPDYYNAGQTHEVGKCLEAWGAHEHTYLWTALVYLSRCGKKEGQDAVEDLQKAKWYIDQEINLREGRGWGEKPLPTEPETKPVPAHWDKTKREFENTVLRLEARIKAYADALKNYTVIAPEAANTVEYIRMDVERRFTNALENMDLGPDPAKIQMPRRRRSDRAEEAALTEAAIAKQMVRMDCKIRAYERALERVQENTPDSKPFIKALKRMADHEYANNLFLMNMHDEREEEEPK